MSKRASIFTLGCRSNQYDGQIIAQSLMDAGYEIVHFSEQAEIYVINTCTVTHRGDSDSRKAVRNALRRNPDAFIIIAGCYPQWDCDTLQQIKGIDLIIGNHEKLNITKYLPSDLKKHISPKVIVSDPTFDDAFGEKVAIPFEKSRALLKIQDGCDRSCSYCIVPHVRGKPRSLHGNKVLSRISELNSSGYKEIVITGINLGCWGRDIGDNLESLVESIETLVGDFRIRFSSIEPMELNSGFVNTILHSTRVSRHMHIPIQSACGRILIEMGRPNTLKETGELLEKIKSYDSSWNIGTDIIIGYPGETEKDFEEELGNLSKLPIDYFHLFTYSPRKGTPASEKSSKVSQAQMKSRLETLKSLDKSRRLRFLESQQGKIFTFILEQQSTRKTDNIIGLSDNYIRAKIAGLPNASGGVVTARIAEIVNRVPIAIPDDNNK